MARVGPAFRWERRPFGAVRPVAVPKYSWKALDPAHVRCEISAREILV